MRIKIYKILSILSIILFLMYWSLSILWPFPDFKYRYSIQNKFYFPKVLFVSGWKLFTPPYRYNQRLYYVVRDVKTSFILDTIEVLENISVQKQLKAPFNQKELIVDYLVNKRVVRLSGMGWMVDKKTATDSFAIFGSDKINQSIAPVQKRKDNNIHLTSLLNYSLLVLKEHHISTDGKEIKIVIKKKIMPPFNERNNIKFERTETTVFESSFMPFL